MLQKTTLTHFIDFSELAVFDEATVDACILGFQKKKSSENILLACSIQKENFKPASFAKNIPTPNFSQNQLTEDTWFFASPQEIQLKAKIENIGTPLKDWDLKINYGIKTGYNDAFIIDQTKRDELAEDQTKLSNLETELLGVDYLLKLSSLFFHKEQVLQQAKKIQKLMEQESKLAKKIEDKENNKIYKNALEWRFEFPEALGQRRQLCRL